MSDVTVEIDGTTYAVELKEVNHGFHHWHDDPHPDGSPGQPAHHHHDEKCTWIPAMLKPAGAVPVVDHVIDGWEDDDLRVSIKLHPEEVEMLYYLVSDQVEEEGDDWDDLLTEVSKALRKVEERSRKRANRAIG